MDLPKIWHDECLRHRDKCPILALFNHFGLGKYYTSELIYQKLPRELDLWYDDTYDPGIMPML